MFGLFIFFLLCPWRTSWHVRSWTGTLFRRSISSVFHWIFILSTQVSHQRFWGAWHYHLSPSHRQTPAAVAGLWTRCLCNLEGWRQWLNGICPTKLPAAFSTVLLNIVVQSCILLGTVWIDSGDFGMTQPLEMRLQRKSLRHEYTEFPPWDVPPPTELLMSHSALYLPAGAGS